MEAHSLQLEKSLCNNKMTQHSQNEWIKSKKQKQNEDHGIWPINSWQIEGGKEAAVTDFIALGSKITSDGDCSHEIKRCFAPWKKSYWHTYSGLKSRDITLPTKVYIVKTTVFPRVMIKD